MKWKRIDDTVLFHTELNWLGRTFAWDGHLDPKLFSLNTTRRIDGVLGDVKCYFTSVTFPL